MRVYYLPNPEAPNRHRILAAVWERNYADFDDSTMVAGRLVLEVDESDANLPELLAFARAFQAVARPGQPPPPRWRVAPPDQLERPNATLWTPEANAERQALFAAMPTGNGSGMVVRLAQIRDGVVGSTLAQTQAAVRDLAIIQLRLLRRLRQREHGTADD